MGIIRRGILGGFSNRVGNVVGSSWKGIATMRVLPLSVANPRTAAQINVRKNFSGITKMASELLTSIVKPLNDRFAVRMSGYNLFIQRNSKAFENDGAFVPSNLTLSHGRLSAPKILSATTANNTVFVQWAASLDGAMDLVSDRAYIAALDTITGEVLGVSAANASRGDAGDDFAFKETLNDIAVYVSFLRADGTEVSPSTYLVADQ